MGVEGACCVAAARRGAQSPVGHDGAVRRQGSPRCPILADGAASAPQGAVLGVLSEVQGTPARI